MKEAKTVWFSLRKSLQCKSEAQDVHEPTEVRKNHRLITTRRSSRSGCSRSIANLKDVVVHVGSSKRHLDISSRPVPPPSSTSCSPRSIGSSDYFLNPNCELLKITTTAVNSGGGNCFGSTLRPGTPGPNMINNTPPRKSPYVVAGVNGCSRVSGEASNLTCHKCGENFTKWEAAELHHLAKHAGKNLRFLVVHFLVESGFLKTVYIFVYAVTELVEGDSSRKIVEIICQTSSLKSESHCGKIERVLKVHNMQKALSLFEEYREMVQIKASKLPKKHPRCLADGNELLRFYGTTVACSLGQNGSSSLCTSDKCRACRIIQNGFSTKKELKSGIGVFTTSTSGRAFECIEIVGEDCGVSVRKALIVCRVIAGRVHRPLENIQEIAEQIGFDSLAGKVGLHSNIEELYLLNARALLPCFVVICKP
ncbi:hypothetical protein ACFE04_002188 [Oxalis oulophora]